MRWDPAKYDQYADERSRPFVDLLSRVDADAPSRVVDIGCGPGTLTALLADRWPAATVEGFDSSPEMIEAASGLARTGLSFRVGDAADWQVPADADVVISNAALQWMPDHRALLARWAASMPAGGWIAVQLPGNFASPSHVVMRELAQSQRWVSQLEGVLRHHDAVGTPQDYATLLLEAGLQVDVWETTYLHRLAGADPVLEWVRGTGLRPVLAALSAKDAEAFEGAYGAALRSAYPATQHGTLFAFRRVFAVGHRPR